MLPELTVLLHGGGGGGHLSAYLYRVVLHLLAFAVVAGGTFWLAGGTGTSGPTPASEADVEERDRRG